MPCVAGAAIDVALTIADNWLSGRKTTLGDIAGSAVSGCVAGYVGAGLGKALKWLGERALRWLGKGEDAAGMLDDVISCAVPRSFAADTPVTTPGGTKPIADVDVGDTVGSPTSQPPDRRKNGQSRRRWSIATPRSPG